MDRLGTNLKMDKAVLVAIATTLLGFSSTTALATSNAVMHLADSDLRVATVGFRLLSRNQANCPRLNPATGLVLHSLEQYGPAVRASALALWNFPSAVSVEAIVAKSPAALAGLQPGDGLAAIDGVTIVPASSDRKHATALRDSLEQQIQALPLGSPIHLTIKRNDRLISVTLHPVPACRTRLEVVAGNSIKARSNGEVIQVGQDFVEQLDDAELAFVLAHELAHTIGEHRQILARLEQDTSALGRRRYRSAARKFEDDADVLALRLLAAAGWDPSIGPRFMRIKQQEYGTSIRGSKTHRSAAARADLMEKAIAEILRIQPVTTAPY